MKKYNGINLLSVFLALGLSALLTLPGFGQPRNAGKLVVPIGYENYDSVRFTLHGIQGIRSIFTNVHAKVHGSWMDYPWMSVMPSVNAIANAYGDSIGATFEGGDELVATLGSGAIDTVIVGGKRKGLATFKGWKNPLSDIAAHRKARTYFPSPSGPLNFHFGKGFYWRYNDVNFNHAAAWHYNTYDSNDISPYCEYPAIDSFVRMTYHSAKFGRDSIVQYGNEGRVLLGYSDDRLANQLLRVHRDSGLNGTVVDTARSFSTTLDFNIDEGSIDTALSAGRADSLLPLMIFQVLFKDGQSAYHPLGGQPVLPFVPFKTSFDTTKLGWYMVAEVIVNKHVYDSLDLCWKAEDTLANGSVSHPWRFKQLHLVLKDLPSSMRAIIGVDSSDGQLGDLGEGSGAGPLAIDSVQNPESLVAIDPSADSRKPYLELRVLSTYRATVRIRGLDYHDTVMDKFLYRKRIAGTLDSTHSCNPDGSIGGFDDTVRARMVADTAFKNFTREFLMNDVGTTGGSLGPLSVPILGYFDFMGSKFNIHAHWREQDSGKNVEQLRRFRMIYDGQPPSLFENQYTFFGGTLSTGGCLVFPQEYVFNGPLDPASTAWPSSNDTIVGIITGRHANADPDSAYNIYETEVSGFSDYGAYLRGSNKQARSHPVNKRMAIEAELQGWAIIHPHLISFDAVHRSSYHFDHRYGYNIDLQRPTTPEETVAMGYMMLAEGIASFNSFQALDMGIFGGGSPGVCGIAKRDTLTQDSIKLTHGYNLGHEYSWRPPDFNPNEWTLPNSSDMCGDLPNFYLGYSNSYRAYARLLSRINSIYDSTHGRMCLHPYKYLTWQDAYSNSRTTNDHFGFGDSSCKAKAFLKIQNTQSVLRWTRGSRGEYLDSAGAFDPQNNSFVEVGLFKDSISSSLINRAAIIVNTHLYPSLRDSEDINYYNQGLDTLSMCHPVYGDIDVRKVYMTIDTTKLEPSFQSSYYVVRDLWHPDTTWLVKSDSQFAIYLKPGDAKFLYFEKAYSILASKKAEVGDQEFCFNNGRRVAERKRGSQTVTCYTRSHKLYVSYAAKGTTFAGYNEHSASDNIATGWEEALDTVNYCARPSIIVGRNDSSVAISYFVKVTSDSGFIRIAYQNAPGAPWKFISYVAENFADSSSDLSQVTPVVTPSSDKSYIVLAGYNTNHLPPFELRAFRFKYGTDTVLHLQNHSTMMFMDSVAPCIFPTIASRPLDSTFWPIRYAWQRRNHIYYAQARDTVLSDANFATVDFEVNPLYKKPRRLDKHLPGCVNVHPSIAMNGTHQAGLTGTAVIMTILVYPPGGGVPYTITIPTTLTSPVTSSQSYYADDYIVWEAQLMDTGVYDTHNQYWPITTASHQPFSYNHSGTRIPGKQFWGGFTIFPLLTGDNGFHYPIVAAEKRYWDNHFRYDSAHGVQYHDWIRMAWQNHTSNDSMEAVHWIPNWRKTLLYDLGKYPSLGQTTDSLEHWTDSSTVPASVVFTEPSANGAGNYPVRITNGLFPLLGRQPQLLPKPGFAIFRKDTTYNDSCPGVLATIGIGTGKLSGTVPTTISWVSPDITLPGFEDDSWPRYPCVRQELRTTQFTYHAGDMINIPRSVDTLDLATLQSQLSSDSDYVIFWVALWKARDSSFIQSLDTLLITKHAINFSTSGLSTGSINYTFPGGTPTDSAFVTAYLFRRDTGDGLERGYLERAQLDTVSPSFKRADQSLQPSLHDLTLTVHPNPFNPSTWIELGAPQSLHVRLELYDMLGRRLQTLYDGDSLQSGNLHLVLDASALASGSYLLRATSGSEVVTRRIVLSK